MYMESNLAVIENGMKNEFTEMVSFYIQKGTKKQNTIGNKINEFSQSIRCYQCLDTKQAWFFRGEEYKHDGKGDYYIMSCQICPINELRDKWIIDSSTCELYSIGGIKLFNKNNHSGVERFQEIERFILRSHPDLNQDPPSYKKSDKTAVTIQKKTVFLKLAIGNIMSKCKDIIKGYCGDLLSITNLLSSIELNISNCENISNQEQIFCEEIDKNNFIFVKILNRSSTKKKSIVGFFEYNKYKLDIVINISVLKPDNESAYKECKNIVNKISENNINDIIDLFV